MSRANVPKFGNWENEDNVPYTVYFDKARKNKEGKMMNPNDPQDNPDPAHGDPKPANETGYGGPSTGSEQSFERSPLHPHHQAKVTGRPSGSPDSGHGTPQRSRLRPTSRGDESPEAGAAVPKFGAWDEMDPQSAENFTHIFNKVREQRNTGPGPGNVSGTPNHPSYDHRSNQTKKRCCGLF